MSKKKLNTESITQELSGAVAAFAQSGSPARPPSAPAAPKKKLARRAEGKPPQPLARRPLGQSTGQAVDQLDGQVLERPKAFYITRRLDRRLDEAVRYFQAQHGLKKVDRSVIVNTLLDDEANWSVESLDLIVDRVIGQLTNRLIG